MKLRISGWLCFSALVLPCACGESGADPGGSDAAQQSEDLDGGSEGEVNTDASVDAGACWMSTVVEVATVSSVTAESGGHTVIAGLFRESAILGDSTTLTAPAAALFIAELGQSGEPLWTKVVPMDTVDGHLGLTIDDVGNITLLAQTCSDPDAGDTCTYLRQEQVSLMQFDAVGHDLAWSSQFGVVGFWPSPKLIATADGGVVVAGTFYAGTMELAGETLTAEPPYPASFAAKFDASGNPVWHRFWQQDVFPSDASASPDGHIWLVGAEVASEDPLFVKPLLVELDGDGNTLERRTVELEESATAALALIGSEGPTVAVMNLQPRFEGGTLQLDGGDIVAALSPSGDVVWSKPVGERFPPCTECVSCLGSRVSHLIADPRGGFVLGGQFCGEVSLADGATMKAKTCDETFTGVSDIFLAGFRDDGALDWHDHYGVCGVIPHLLGLDGEKSGAILMAGSWTGSTLNPVMMGLGCGGTPPGMNGGFVVRYPPRIR